MFADKGGGGDRHKASCPGDVPELDKGVFILPVSVNRDQNRRCVVPTDSLQTIDGFQGDSTAIDRRADDGELTPYLPYGVFGRPRRGEVAFFGKTDTGSAGNRTKDLFCCAGG